MDTLFRLVSLHSSDNHQQQQQQQHSSNSFNSSRTSTNSSRSASKHHHHHHHHHQNNNENYSYHYQQQNPNPSYNYYQLHQNSSSTQEEQDQEECCNNPRGHHLFMDDDFSSSSNPNPNPSSSFSVPQNLPLTNLDGSTPGWGPDLLLECARAIAGHNTAKVQQSMWILNELASPYGDPEQKIAHYFLQALFARLTSTGPRNLRTLSSASDKTTSFDSTRRTILRFQELSPWASFGHVAANGAILEAFLDAGGSSEPAQRLHILDFSNTYCTQWPTLLEALATRSADDTPHLTITTVVLSPSPVASSSAVQRVMKEIGARMEKFARLMGVPFRFKIIHHEGDLSNFDLDQVNIDENSGEPSALAINCINSLHTIAASGRRRDTFISLLRRLRPRIVTVVEEEADLVSTEELDEEEQFLKGFRESLRFFSAYFDSLEESFPKTSNERLALERAAGRAVVDLLACPAGESAERRETGGGWATRMRAAGLAPAPFSHDVADDVRALLRRYREGWAMASAAEEQGLLLTWKEQAVVWASAWRAP